MKLTKNFSLEEFEQSNTAKKYNIDNTIPEKYRDNVYRLACVLQIIRDEYNKPIKISSGYRCKQLNTKVGGALHSDHLYSAAADCSSLSDTEKDNMELWNIVMKLVKEGKIQCRQIIFEYGHKNIGPNWLHISVNNDYNTKKNNQVLYLGCK